jgi:hypothetical protein
MPVGCSDFLLDTFTVLDTTARCRRVHGSGSAIWATWVAVANVTLGDRHHVLLLFLSVLLEFRFHASLEIPAAATACIV